MVFLNNVRKSFWALYAHFLFSVSIYKVSIISTYKTNIIFYVTRRVTFGPNAQMTSQSKMTLK